MERRKFIGALSFAGILGTLIPQRILADEKHEPSVYAKNDRDYWYKLLYKIAGPVVHNLANGTLIKNMPLEKSPTFDSRSPSVTYLEAVGRTYAGIAPWLALPDDETKEGILRKSFRNEAIKGLNKCFTPGSADALNFSKDHQPIVDAAYLAQAFLRAPKALWEPLEAQTKTNIITSFKSLRNRKPFKSNWLLFGSITEAFLLTIGEEPDTVRLNEGPKMLNEWYKGDGWYGDGPNYAFDYYNSFVIHSMMVDTLAIMAAKNLVEQKVYDLALKRMQRHAVGQERMISPEGTYPPIGRSITYRTGAFQVLAQVSLMEKLPAGIKPAQVRCALTKVKQNMYETPGTFDKNGWLQLGFCGHEPEIADYYTSTGSLYMATLSFLPLGLPADHEFWTGAPVAWTAKQAWAGKGFAKDYHVDY
ncbi:DUF2264 domain-containing protein [Pedobacter africanus]|uniref:DUF2264 domain-containing protein n=1 Tax=Pedobacter africanus TaxID=151894 RepID=A0A1W2B483_9SPHI|nr:DUF2264 domain-containing protein [Pedobacter africanus]SMC67512.1 hypothetical protein SAMN04488524_1879 [Pedobacter africanus]